MRHDPHRDIRRHLATEAHSWHKQAMNEAMPHLEAVPDTPSEAVAPQRPIVVGYDGTAGALPALRWAVQEASDRQIPLVIVRAWQWDDELAEPGLVGPQDRLEELAYSTLPDWARAAEGASVVLAPRAAGPAIVEQGSAADLIVVGRRRLGALQRAWLGSTSAYVMQHAPCPVVVVPETAGVAGQPAVPAASQHEAPTGSDGPK